MACSRFGLFASCFTLSAVVLASAGCGGARENDAAVGEVSIALGVVPTGIACVRITAAGPISITKTVSTAAGSTVTLQMTGLPLGPVVFSAQAFSQACSSVTSSSMPLWLSDSVTVTLLPGSKPAITLVMKTAPTAAITVDFNPDAGPDVCTPGTTVCVGTSVQTCSPSGAWVISACPFSCVAGACIGICVPGATQCSGNTPQVCTTSGAWQNAGSACSGCYTCSAATGACVANTGASCDDGNACTSGETCHAGVCTGGTTVTCPAPATCRGAGTCNPSTGACTYPWLPDNSSCSDGDVCTLNDYCLSGTCRAGAPLMCAATPCHVAGTCSAGSCSQGAPVADGTTDLTCPASTPRCYSGSCVACVGDNGCPSNTPSCNLSTHKCACRIPSTGNLVQNPGFDTNLAGWTTSSSSWTSADADGCSGSGSVSGSNTDGDPKQCVQLPGGSGTYYFGAKFSFTNNYNGSFCTVSFYSDTSCATPVTSDFVHMGPDGFYGQGAQAGAWQTFFITELAPTGSRSALIVCALDSTTTKLDEFYLNRSSNSF